jgi:ketosteroid isomerase-like protein
MMTNDIDIRQEVALLRDELAVRRVVEGYSDAVNCRDSAAYAALFDHEAVWTLGAPMNRRIEGRASIVRYLDSVLGAMDFMVQMVHNVMVTIDGDTAHSRATVREVGRAADGGKASRIPALSVLALYEDELRRSGNRWRFVTRRFSIIYYDHEMPPGIAQRPC